MKRAGKDGIKHLLVTLKMIVAILQVIDLIVELPVLVDEVNSKDGSNKDMLELASDIV